MKARSFLWPKERNNLRVSTAWSLQGLQGVRQSSAVKQMHKAQNPTHKPKREAMVIDNALVARLRNDWIVASEATSHMFNDRSIVTEY